VKVCSRFCVVIVPSESRERVDTGKETLNPFQVEPTFPYFPALEPMYTLLTTAREPAGRLWKAKTPTVAGGGPRNVTVDSAIADWKAATPIEVTELGIVIAVSALVSWKALGPMDVTELGIVMDAKALLLNTLSPMVVMEFGKLMEDSEVADLKARSPIDVTEFGIAIEVSPVAPSKAWAPMVVTVFGMVTEVSSVAFMNPKGEEPLLMRLTPGGILAWPAQFEWLTTTRFVTVKVPVCVEPVMQGWVPFGFENNGAIKLNESTGLEAPHRVAQELLS